MSTSIVRSFYPSFRSDDSDFRVDTLPNDGTVTFNNVQVGKLYEVNVAHADAWGIRYRCPSTSTDGWIWNPNNDGPLRIRIAGNSSSGTDATISFQDTATLGGIPITLRPIHEGGR